MGYIWNRGNASLEGNVAVVVVVVAAVVAEVQLACDAITGPIIAGDGGSSRGPKTQLYSE